MLREAQRLVGVGAVTARSARIWARCAGGGQHFVRARPRGEGWWGPGAQEQEMPIGRHGCGDPVGVRELTQLWPDTDYEFEVRCVTPGSRRSDRAGQGRFRTAPATAVGSRPFVRVAVMSCHQPFDSHGNVREDARAMLAATDRLLREQQVSFVLLLGDQMYADQPNGHSLFSREYLEKCCDGDGTGLVERRADEVRALYQRRYRQFWSVPEWQDILRHNPCYPMLDDHEIVDNFGSDPVHASSRWRSLRTGALQAFVDYQALFVRDVGAFLPESFHYSIDRPDIAVFVADLRTPRAIGEGRLLGDRQLCDLADWFERNQDRPVLVLASTVPLVHVPETLVQVGAKVRGEGSDFADRLSHPAFAREYDALCALLQEQREKRPEQKLILLGGDIHLGAIAALRWGEAPPAHQLITSGITNAAGLTTRLLTGLALRATQLPDPAARDSRPSVKLVGGGAGRNPYCGLNLGIVELRFRGDAPPDVHLALYGHAEGEARRVLAAGPL